MISGRWFLSLITISVGIIIACSSIRQQGVQYNEAKMVPMPLVGGTERTMNAQGPWPACVGMEGEACLALIQAAAPDVQDLQIVSEDAFMTMDYRTDRVRIMVNAQGFVAHIPSRG
ncbi:hypothetical protein FisN_8Lu264 [Fistulifera solaris]|uniref:Uncharacterized protein n=1 Tax=Fistulifera solaris TaxID=1519565 RepID=A0A1Z5JN97_FISSO|nr:hypothetical protein FisN_8Lu264 [Fistulifera solaris]|eukprot:GAX15485.1 hypothetical protein FisN_8Lu264 [Fistulifera solaris]